MKREGIQFDSISCPAIGRVYNAPAARFVLRKKESNLNSAEDPSAVVARYDTTKISGPEYV